MEEDVFPSDTFRLPLIQAANDVAVRVQAYKELAMAFYFEVLYSLQPCPKCGGKLGASGPSRASCACGATLDPTVEFQRSSCCDAPLVKKVFHYACRRCGKPVQSLFLFDERVFDCLYFKEMMRESRERRERKREELRVLLANTRSLPLELDSSDLSDGFLELDRALNEFVGSVRPEFSRLCAEEDPFVMEHYRQAMLDLLISSNVRFSAFRPLCRDFRKDRARRFITLIYMEHAREVDLVQRGEDILVRRHEAHAEG